MNLVYDVLKAVECKEQRHPQAVVKELGIKYKYSKAYTTADKWVFNDCTNIPSTLPIFIKDEPMKDNEAYAKALQLKDKTIKDLVEQINELNDIIKQQEFMISRRDVIIRFLATGKADTQGEPIVKD
jgi:hypothetical protein